MKYAFESSVKNLTFIMLFDEYLEREAPNDIEEIRKKMKEYMKRLGIEEFEKAYITMMREYEIDI